MLCNGLGESTQPLAVNELGALCVERHRRRFFLK